jgi:hypothetical protein
MNWNSHNLSDLMLLGLLLTVITVGVIMAGMLLGFVIWLLM